MGAFYTESTNINFSLYKRVDNQEKMCYNYKAGEWYHCKSFINQSVRTFLFDIIPNEKLQTVTSSYNTLKKG